MPDELKEQVKEEQADNKSTSVIQLPSGKGSGLLLQSMGQQINPRKNRNSLAGPSNQKIYLWREMRNDPTIALARAVATAPIRSINASVEADDDVLEERIELIRSTVDTLWRSTIENLIFSMDYGWQSFEKVFNVVRGAEIPGDHPGLKDNSLYMVLRRLKSLIPEYTSVVVLPDGQYNGLKNGPRRGMNGEDKRKYLGPEKSFWYTHDKEGDNWYGQSVMHRAEEAYFGGKRVGVKADEYITKNAKPIPIIEYPEGESVDQGGRTVNNQQIAETVLAHLGKSLGVAVPSIAGAYIDALIKSGVNPNKINAWNINFLESSGNHGTEFTDFMRNHDINKFRAWLVPERAAMEGKYGTKAESEVQGDLVLVNADLVIQNMTEWFNTRVVDQLLVMNFGEEARGTVRATTERLDPFRSALLREIIRGIFSAPINAELFTSVAAWDTILEMLGVPVAENAEQGLADYRERIAKKEIEAPSGQTLSRTPEEEEYGELNGVIYKKVNGIWVKYNG